MKRFLVSGSPSEPPTPNAAHACVHHGAPRSVALSHAPFRLQ
jgi:hypothetical protein